MNGDGNQPDTAKHNHCDVAYHLGCDFQKGNNKASETVEALFPLSSNESKQIKQEAFYMFHTEKKRIYGI